MNFTGRSVVPSFYVESIRRFPMPSSVKLAVSSVMVPWIIGLVVLFCISSVSPDRPLLTKYGAAKGSSAFQAVDHTQFPEHSTPPLVKLPSIFWSQIGLAAPSSYLLRVVRSKDRRVIPSPDGVARGRAPPARQFA